jgi:hypothetical protein
MTSYQHKIWPKKYAHVSALPVALVRREVEQLNFLLEVALPTHWNRCYKIDHFLTFIFLNYTQ